MPKKIPRAKFRPPNIPQVGDTSKQQERQDDRDFYRSLQWRNTRKTFLMLFPMCETENCPRFATEVHHKIPRKERPDLAFDFGNLSSRCKPCHSRIEYTITKQKYKDSE